MANTDSDSDPAEPTGMAEQIENWMWAAADRGDWIDDDLFTRDHPLAAAYWLEDMLLEWASAVIGAIEDAGGDLVARGLVLSQLLPDDKLARVTAPDSPLRAGYAFDQAEAERIIGRAANISESGELSRIVTACDASDYAASLYLAVEYATNDEMHPEIALFIVLHSLNNDAASELDDWSRRFTVPVATALADAFERQRQRESPLVLPPIIV